MGRGSAYGYDYFMLIDDEGLEEWQIDQFKEDVMEVFELFKTNLNTSDRDSIYIGIDNDDTLLVGLDWSGGLPCIFVEQYESDYYDPEEDGELPDITDRVVKGFNELIKFYGTEFFRRPTSAWTSEFISEYTV